jgi:WD40 repeat protein
MQMQTPVAIAAGQVTDILGRIASLAAEYEESMRLLNGLSGALGVMTEFLQRRVGEGVEISPRAMSHALKTLEAIRSKVEEIHALLGKRFLGFGVGRWYVYGAPLFGSCLGRAGSSRIVKQLADLQSELANDIKFLELQMTASAVDSLSAISASRANLARAFGSRDAREFWMSNFQDEYSVDQEEFSARLARVRPECAKLCAYLAADLARRGIVDVSDFARGVGETGMDAWIESSVRGSARTVLVPGHYGPVAVMAARDGYLVTGGEDSTVNVFALSDKGVPVHRVVLVGHSGPVTCLSLSVEDGAVASGSSDGCVRTWCLYSGDAREVRRVGSEVTALEFAAGVLVYTCLPPSMSIDVREARSGEFRCKLYGHSGGVSSLALDGDRLFSSGADRSVKQWTLSGRCETAMVPQAHSTSIRRILLHEHFVASVSGRDVRFYDPRDIRTECLTVRVCDPSGADRRFVHASCVSDAARCVVLATAGKSGSRLHAVFPKDRGGVRFETRVAGCRTCSVASGKDVVYVGLRDGAILWYSITESGFVRVGSVASATEGTSPVLVRSGAMPILACSDEDAVIAYPPDRLAFHPCGKTEVFEEPVTAVARCDDGDGWVVACGGYLLLYDALGVRRGLVEVGGFVASIRCSAIQRKMYVDVERAPNVRTILVCDSSGNVSDDSVCESCPADTTCGASLVLEDRYLVWPSGEEGFLSVMDASSLRKIAPVRFSDVDVDPVTAVAGLALTFFTLHGGLDVLMWSDVASAPTRRFKTFESPIASMAVVPGGRLVAGGAEGMVFAEECREDHALGPVCVSACPTSGFFSIGVEGSLVRHRH